MSPGRRPRARRRCAGAIACAAALVFVPVRSGSPQQQQQQVARVDTLSSTASSIPRGSVLARVVSVRLVSSSIEGALREVATQADLRLSYSSDIIPTDLRVTLSRQRVAAGEVIREVLRDTDLDVVVSPSGYVIVVRTPWRSLATALPAGDSSRLPLVQAPPLRAVARPQIMDRILVMGSPAAGSPERSLSSAVSVVTAAQIAHRGVESMEQLFRSGIPGIVSWDLGISGPFGQISSVRGSSSFTSNYLKTYVDGVELASPYLLFAIDPYSIERIEVIRGPQGSALYGSDAISGVVQVVTRKGTPAAKWRPQADASLSAGRMESRYTDGANAMQRHSAMLFTGGGTTSLGVGGTYESVGAVIPGSESGYRGTYGGFRTMLGSMRVDAAMRYADVRFTSASNPLLRNATLQSSITPLLEPQRIENETYGVTADWQPTEWWRQTLVVGLDRHAGSIPPQREQAAVADALLGATQEHVSKASLRYSMTARLLDAPGARVTATAGAERSVLDRERLGTRSEVVGSGTGLTTLYFDEVRNTGLFGQLKLDVANSLFVTAGLRGERNSSFGENYGTAYAPMVGAAWTRDLGGATTLKLRTAYGKGIRPPPPIARRSIQTAGFRQVGNPDLQPEVQAGTEGGLELYVGDRTTLSFTAYTQNAEGLVQQVLPPASEGARTIEYQNVGRIQNRGVELEGNVRAGSLRGDLSFALTDSRVRALANAYTGELRVGDRVPEIPKASGLASLTYEAWRVRATVGASYIGSWVGYDWIDFYEADAGVAPPKETLRGYWTTYSSLTKPFVGFSYAMGRGSEWYVRVDNLTNLQRYERDDLLITQGRTAKFGVRLQR